MKEVENSLDNTTKRTRENGSFFILEINKMLLHKKRIRFHESFFIEQSIIIVIAVFLLSFL